MANTVYGVTPTGFVAKTQQIIIQELQSAFQAVFGANINLAAEAVFGNLIGIFSGQMTELWQLDEAVYDSEYPEGAEGTSVDNVLSFNNLRRLPATPTKTNPLVDTQANLINLYGLVLFGVAGTVVPKDSIIQTNDSPPLQFKLDAAVTIAAAMNAVQSVFLSNVPDTGAFQLSIVNQATGQTLTTANMPYNVISNQSQFQLAGAVSGTFKISLTLAGVTLQTAAINYNATPMDVQSAIAALSGYSGVAVTGSSLASGLQFVWGAIPQPTVAISANGTSGTATIVDSAQAFVNNLLDTSITKYPFTDVLCTGFTTGLIFTFGANTPVSGQLGSGNKPQPIFIALNNTLQQGIIVTNLNIINSTDGAPAQGIGAATCAVTGPNFVKAGNLNTIGSPTSGWTGVTNQLDCITGTNVETDTEALQRRTQLLAAQANGPIQAIVAKVLKVSGVSQSLGFQNLTLATQQVIAFSAIPSTGHYAIIIEGHTTSNINFGSSSSVVQTAVRALPGFSTALVTGNEQFGFIIDFNGAFGGQAIHLSSITNNTTGVTITTSFGRPGKSFEIVAQGGTDEDIALAIYQSMPAGILSYGSTTVQIQDVYGNPRNISFSRPEAIDFYVSISLVTDQYLIPGDSGSGVNPNAKFNPQSVLTIQQDIIDIGNSIAIGGLVIGFGSDGLIGAFNDVPGIISYTLFFGESPNPTLNANIQLQSEQAPFFESFNVIVSYE